MCIFRQHITLTGLLVSVLTAYGQQEMGTHMMRNALPASHTQPAFTFDASEDTSFALSLISASAGYGNENFHYRHLVRPHPNKTGYHMLDVDNVLARLNNINRITGSVAADLFHASVKQGNFYLSFGMRERAEVRLRYHRDLARVLWHGNAPYIGKNAHFSLSLQAAHFRELFVGATWEKGNWTVGGRLKYLAGIMDISTQNGQGTLYTSPMVDSLMLTGNYEIYTSGVETRNETWDSYLFRSGNDGGAIDLGIVYNGTLPWSLSLSVLDIGFITWQRDTRHFMKQGTSLFEGVTIDGLFINESFSASTYVDSLTATFDITRSEGKYTSWLIPRFYMSARYAYSPTTYFHLALYSEEVNRYMMPGLAMGYQTQVLPWLDIMATNTIIHRRFFNLGAGAYLNVGKWRVHLVSDNLFGLVFPRYTRVWQARAGAAMVF